MYYGKINPTDIANGPGVRVTLFVSGCRNRCKGCFNPETWDFCYGQPFTEETENEILTMLKPFYISGLTLLGGDPLEPENAQALLPFVRKVKQLYPQKEIWCYTGYLYENIKDTPLIAYVDVLVDGPFVEAKKDIRLQFRGSSNQRILNLKELRSNEDTKNP